MCGKRSMALEIPGFNKYTITLLMLALLCACQSGDIVENETVEAFGTETYTEQGQTLEASGYKKVNAITYVKENKQYIETRIRAIEDYYDSEGNYLRTEIFDQSGRQSKWDGTVDSDEKRDEAVDPLTLYVPDAEEASSSRSLDEAKQAEIRELVESCTDQLR
ncbi:hypothetical protein IDH44_00425 [Paenibacillus sp. IB182496]|uniref:Uncharacterized protein n=1 Tax=Paenibacillus sabuli TaxID=2772509 RepID=A0A927BQH7_9BACL|nr:hypothetical protein [Paenibacillus sabuli]MBD2843638.1 hypothetical protein [Paenibacillus sabuli]